MSLAPPHKEIHLWRFLENALEKDGSAMLLIVTHHQGSSPGRGGFKMALDAHGNMYGSIGGGIMEHKLVEWCKTQLNDKQDSITIKHQIHQEQASSNRSGMICSGEQYVAMVPLHAHHSKMIREIIHAMAHHQPNRLMINAREISFGIDQELGEQVFEIENPQQWSYQECLGFKHFLYIVGGGHCSLALSELASRLDFHITVFDDRQQLHTMEINQHAHQKQVIKYQELAAYIPEGKGHYVIIMTFGYRSDTVALRALLGKEFAYLGVLGSEAKIKTMFKELIDEGVDTRLLNSLDAPAGVGINSQTPHEIAVSIAAKLVASKRH